MFARGTVPDMSKMMMDPQKIAQLRQMAESMRAAQMSGMRQTFPQQQQPPPSGTTTQQPTPQTVTCASCNTVNPLGSKFCNNCGKPLSPAKKTCPKCGQQSDPNIKFCGNCGNKLP
jgi:membrane protease subunit (stomatin/prohibitin family)